MELYTIEFKDEKAEQEAENAVTDISIVSNPSHNVKGFCFSKDFIQFSKISEGKYCALLLRADYPIYRAPNPYMPNGGYVEFKADFIKKIQETNYAKKSFSFQHNENERIEAELTENWLVLDTEMDKTKFYGIEATVGSWAGVLKFETDNDFEKAKAMQGGISLEFNSDLVVFKKKEEKIQEQIQENANKFSENQKNSNQIKDNNIMTNKIKMSYVRDLKPSDALKFQKPSAFKEKLLSNSGFLAKIDEIAETNGKSIRFASEADAILENADTMANEVANAMAVDIVDAIVGVADEVMTAEIAPLEQALAENEALKAEIETLKSELEALKSSSQASADNASAQFSSQEFEALKQKNADLEAMVAEGKKIGLSFAEQETKSEMAVNGKTELEL
jgi:hypothetical protein